MQSAGQRTFSGRVLAPRPRPAAGPNAVASRRSCAAPTWSPCRNPSKARRGINGAGRCRSLQPRWQVDEPTGRLRLDASEGRREGHVGSVSAGSEANQSHLDRCARRFEDVPAVAQKYLDVGLKVRRTEHRVGSVVGAGRKACRDVDGTTQRNHQAREVAAKPLDQRVDSRSRLIRRLRLEGTWPCTHSRPYLNHESSALRIHSLICLSASSLATP
jgi:hypothetical protein